MISVIIPMRDDLSIAKETVDNLCSETDKSEFEIIMVDDGTKNSSGQLNPITKEDFDHSNVRVISNEGEFGVGYSFDRGVFEALGDIIVLAGCDILPRKGSWLQSVLRNVREGEIGCCASVGLTPDNRNLDKEGRYVRYGADLLYTIGIDDLPTHSALRRKQGGYTALFEAKWATKKGDEPYEIPCLLGAFYWTTKEFYNKIHGWDTEKGVRFQGHQNWGSLEPYLSLKTKIYGGKLRVYPDFEVGHVFGRINQPGIGNFISSSKRVERSDLHWFNRLFMVHTMTEDPLKSVLLNFPLQEYPLELAKKYIKENWDKVEKVRERNIREAKLLTENTYKK
jgi:glycosyltransferase involved in cell wall biosynthesis